MSFAPGPKHLTIGFDRKGQKSLRHESDTPVKSCLDELAFISESRDKRCEETTYLQGSEDW